MAEVRSTFYLQNGDSAPSFQLSDGSGETHSLEEVQGEKGTLVVFACNHCPYVIHLAKELGDLAREAATKGVKTVAISSNDVKNYPQDGPEKMVEFA